MSLLLDRVSDERVFSLEPHTKGMVTIVEKCDSYFEVVLTFAEVRELAAEMIKFVDELETAGDG